MTLLLLIRHGANDFTKEGVLAGWTPGVHLNEEGRTQAEALAQRLTPIKIEAVYSSPLERAVETAEIIAAPHKLAVTVREGLGEVHFGTWTGEPLDKLKRRRLWRAVQSVPSTMRFPGGESFRDMQARIVSELEVLRDEHKEKIVAVISHADVIKAAVAHYAGIHLDLFQRLTVSPASLTMLALGKSMHHLVCLNDTGHLPHLFEGKKNEPA